MVDKYLEHTEETGDPVPEVEEEKPVPSWATKEDLAEMKGLIEGLSTSFSELAKVREHPTPAPSGPSIEQQISEIDEQLVKVRTQIDEAIESGKGVSSLLTKQEQLQNRKIDIKHSHEMNELRNYGTFAIDQLTDQVVSTKMDLLKIPEVKASYEKSISNMSPDQRMNPEVRMAAYQYACGANMDKVLDMKFQEHLRKGEETAETQTPASPGRTQDEREDPNRIPEPHEVLSPDNLAALDAVGKTVDTYYKGLGYKNWEDYWKRVGKAHFRGEEETEENE